MTFLHVAHLFAMLLATIATAVVRAHALAVALAAGVVVDAIYAMPSTWQIETALAFLGPASVIAATLRTHRVHLAITTLVVAPLAPLALVAVGAGQHLGPTGIAWLLVMSHGYAALVGFGITCALGAWCDRLHDRLLGMLIATSAPGAIGWACSALGGSMRVAVVVDVVFLAAVTVGALAAWVRRNPGT